MKRLFLKLPINRVLVLLILLLYQSTGFSQPDISDKIVIVPEYSGSVKKLLDMVGEKENIVFAYSNEVDLTYIVTTKVAEVPLKQFLDNIFTNKGIEIKIQGNKVMLYNSNSEAFTFKYGVLNSP